MLCLVVDVVTVMGYITSYRPRAGPDETDLDQPPPTGWTRRGEPEQDREGEGKKGQTALRTQPQAAECEAMLQTDRAPGWITLVFKREVHLTMQKDKDMPTYQEQILDLGVQDHEVHD